MTLTSHAIVLHRRAYNDRYFIAQVYSRELGRIGVLVPQGRRTASISRSSFSPLTELELELRQPRKGGGLYLLRQSHRLSAHWRIQVESSKSAQVLFISELLSRALGEGQADEPTYDFIRRGIEHLETMEQGVANFYLFFCFRLLHHLAIEPNLVRPSGYNERMWFDLIDSSYTPYPTDVHYALPPEVARLLPVLRRLSYDRLSSLMLNREQRSYILDWTLTYYRLHLPDFPMLRSLQILRGAHQPSGSEP